MTLRKTAARPRERWALLIGAVAVLTLTLAAVSFAVHDVGEFELDKDASNNTNYTRIGDLGANVNASTTAIPVCQFSATNPPNGSVILIEAERMTVNSVGAGSFGGNCSPGVKRQYNVAARAGGVAHAKGDVKGFISLITTPTLEGPDWNQVHSVIGSDPTCESIGLAECAFVSDQIGPSIFIGGGSKDHEEIDQWQWTTGGSPDKAEILNAYAAKAIDEENNDDQILYFGMDRWAVDGSTDIGFWFFKKQVVACPDPNVPASVCAGVPDGHFAGEHQGTLQTDGDILALATFTQGGAATNIRVFRWVGTGGNESGSVEGPAADAGDCIQEPPLTDDELCGTVNNTSIEVPWTYTFKGAAVGKWVPAGGFFEGGINLSELGLEGCFSSFLAETRSSPEITAILKDFALGQFEACDTKLKTTPKTGAGAALTADSDGDNLDEISIGTGSVLVTDSAALEVKGTDTFTGSLDFYLCGPIANPNTCSTAGVHVGAAVGVNPVTANGSYLSAQATVTSVGRYCWFATFTSGTEGVPDAADGVAESAGPPKSTGECFEVLPVTPTLDTDAGDGPVDFGQAVTDTATLGQTATRPGTLGPNATYPTINPTVAGLPANGTITFQLYGPFTSGTPTPAECQALGLAAGFATANPNGIQRAVSGNGTYPTASQAAVSYIPQAPGWYFWKASYDGSSPNTNASGEHNTTCTDTDEAVLVRQIPTVIATRQFVFPQDRVRIDTNPTGLTLAGNVQFRLFGPTGGATPKTALQNCQTDDGTATSLGLAYKEGPTNISGAGPQFLSTNNTQFKIVDSGVTYVWRVIYTSTNSAQLGSTSNCVESTAVTYAGNEATITIP